MIIQILFDLHLDKRDVYALTADKLKRANVPSATRQSSNSTSKFFSTLLYLPFVEERPTLTPYNDQKIASRASSFPLISLMMEKKRKRKRKERDTIPRRIGNLIYRRAIFASTLFFFCRLISCRFFFDPCLYLYPREEDRMFEAMEKARIGAQNDNRACAFAHVK